jgi:hypothetical protein
MNIPEPGAAGISSPLPELTDLPKRLTLAVPADGESAYPVVEARPRMPTFAVPDRVRVPLPEETPLPVMATETEGVV